VLQGVVTTVDVPVDEWYVDGCSKLHHAQGCSYKEGVEVRDFYTMPTVALLPPLLTGISQMPDGIPDQNTPL
jgi:hypothetical protein